MTTAGAGTGTSGVTGIKTVLLYGNPAKPGPYVLEIRVPANTVIAAHTHRDNRFATVISGTWYFGFGTNPATVRVKALTAGGLYTEPGKLPTSPSRATSPRSSASLGWDPATPRSSRFRSPVDPPLHF
jgi:hypothetical protein